MSGTPVVETELQWRRQTEKRLGWLERRPTVRSDPPTAVTYEQPTYTGTWVNYGTNYHEGGYFKTSSGIVCLTGLIQGGTLGTTAFNLPAGYHSDANRLAPIYSAGGVSWCFITNYGAVAPGGSWASLASIMYPAAGVADWIPVTTFMNGFNSFHTIDSGYPPLAYWSDPLGRVHWQGMLTRPTAITADVAAFTMPSEYAPFSTPVAGAQIHLPGVTNSGPASYHIAGGGPGLSAFYVKAGTVGTNWMTLDRCMYLRQSHAMNASIRTLNLRISDWSNYGGGFPYAALAVFPDGIAMMQGLITNGSIGSNKRVLNTPEGASPDNSIGYTGPGTDIFLINSLNAAARTDITRWHDTALPAPGSALMANDGSAIWRSLNGINYLIGS